MIVVEDAVEIAEAIEYSLDALNPAPSTVNDLFAATGLADSGDNESNSSPKGFIALLKFGVEVLTARTGRRGFDLIGLIVAN